MPRPVPSLLFAAALAVGVVASRGPAQTASAPPPAPGPAASLPLDNWPRPPEEPRSLYREAADAPAQCAPVRDRYFVLDPLLDPPSFGQPGFVASFEVQAAAPHVFNTLANGVAVGASPADSIRLPIAGFAWGASPRVEAGYRLGSGFGEYLASYRYLGTTGSAAAPAPYGPGSLRSRFDLNVIDLDYSSREFTPWAYWGMRWRVGVRTALLFYDTRLDLLPAAATANGNVVQQSAFDSFRGVGPHAGVELSRNLGRPGLCATAAVDYAQMLGRLKQGVTQTTAGQGVDVGTLDNGQSVPSLIGRLGVNYETPGSRLSVFAGGFYEYWWNVGRLSNFSVFSRGDLSITGVTVQVKWNY